MKNFQFNKSQFLSAVEKSFGRLSGAQTQAFIFLLSKIEGDASWQTIQQIAYYFATLWRETGMAMKPVVERGPRSYFDKYDTGRLARTLGNTPDADGDGYTYRGRGNVQDTGRANYRKVGNALAGKTYFVNGETILVMPDTFIKRPDLLLDSAVSYDDSVDGMFTGRYTGKSIQTFINERKCDYVNARRVINGLDHANEIANNAVKFEKALRSAAQLGEPATPEKRVEVPHPNMNESKVVEDNLTVNDVMQHVSTDTAKSFAVKAGWKVAAGVGGAWELGVTGKVLVIIGVAVVVGVAAYEVRRHWNQLKPLALKMLRGA